MNFEHACSPAARKSAVTFRRRFLPICNFLLSICLCAVTLSATAQRIDRQGARNAFYAEASSFGPAVAVHYDRIFRQGEKLDYSTLR